MKDVVPRRAWLLLAAGDSRGHGGNFGYDDQIDAYYSWDSNVQNHKSLAVGDPVALWDKERLLGVSVIEEIRKSPGVKALNRCPRCNLTRIDDRKTSEPRYRCKKCHAEFATPHLDVVDVLEYKARYDAAWTSLDGVLDGSELRTLVTNVRSFNSIRALNWSAFRRALIAKEAGRAVDRVNARVDLSWELDHGAPVEFPQGFGHALVRVRRGQKQFREHLLASQGNVCAFTGDAPSRVLEAGHLYSYARLGTHFEHGGLMLRRDIHRLFDDGLLAVQPSNLHIDVAPELATYPQYARLHDQSLNVRLSDDQVDWLGEHWNEHRPDA